MAQLLISGAESAKLHLKQENVLQVIFGINAKQYIFCSPRVNENKRHTLLTFEFKKESNQFVIDS